MKISKSKQQAILVNEIELLAEQFLGHKPTLRIKSHSIERLVARLGAYRQMVDLNNRYVELSAKTPKALDDVNRIPAIIEACEYRMQALFLWRAEY